MNNKPLEQLRIKMKEHEIDACIIPMSDYHLSEYVGEHFKVVRHISGFTGSAGTVVVTENEAGLWTDGRYFIQAEKELKGKGVTLYKQGVKGVPTIKEFLKEKLQKGGTVGIDGKVISSMDYMDFSASLAEKEITMNSDFDVIDSIWENRPQLPKDKGFLFPEKYSGKSTKEKLEEVRDVIRKDKIANMHILSTLEDIAWLFNFRGNDIAYTPVILANVILTETETILFSDKSKFTGDLLKQLEENHVEIKDYLDFYNYLKTLDNKNILIDLENTNRYTEDCIRVNKSNMIKHIKNPTTMMKATKNQIELENIRKAYEKDGVACTEMMYYLKEGRKSEKNKEQLTEISAAEKILAFRKMQDNFIEESFATISGYAENAAIVHYTATENNYKKIEDKGLLLIDSGGHYFEGTTDITRTFAMGELTEVEKTHFTLVLKSMINLASAKFLYGATGGNLDILARQPMWNLNLNYNHGTGHGVGHVLSVHEGPASLRWSKTPDGSSDIKLETGMVLTDEPGIYIEGSHGIRIENQLIVVDDIENEYGKFLKFETVTLCPIDLDAVRLEMMTREEIQWLKDYHKKIYDRISDKLKIETKAWLEDLLKRLD